MSATLAATTTASTKRAPAASGGRVGAPTTYLTGLAVVPILPAATDLTEQAQLQNPREAKQTFLFADSANALPDIAEGDLLVVAGVEYLVHLVNEWPRPAEGSYLEILMTQRKVSTP